MESLQDLLYQKYRKLKAFVSEKTHWVNINLKFQDEQLLGESCLGHNLEKIIFFINLKFSFDLDMPKKFQNYVLKVEFSEKTCRSQIKSKLFGNSYAAKIKQKLSSDRELNWLQIMSELSKWRFYSLGVSSKKH